MDDAPPARFKHFLRVEEDFARESVDRFVALYPPEFRVREPLIPKAGDEYPSNAETGR